MHFLLAVQFADLHYASQCFCMGSGRLCGAHRGASGQGFKRFSVLEKYPRPVSLGFVLDFFMKLFS